MARVIAYDLTRLFLGPLSASPRGIDRVDVALANHFFSDDKSPNRGILPTPWGMRSFSARVVRRGLDHLAELWAEQGEDAQEPRWPELVAALHGRAPGLSATVRRKPMGSMTKGARMLRHLRRTGVSLGRSATALAPGSIYLNIGQIGLAVPAFLRWLSRRPDIASVIMLHDVIPLEYPGLVSTSAVAHHARMVRSAMAQADAIVTTTDHARDTILATMAGMGCPDMPIHVRGLPLPAVLGRARRADPALAGCHYFLTCSTIEPRKNHALLIAVWRGLVARMGGQAPHLVIVGSAGRHAEQILAPLAGDAALARHVHHVQGLSSPALARLTLGAAAMLCPSLAEGFGLSVLEANALGVPTIASDIAAHREIADAGTLLLPTDDQEGWAAAILAQAMAGPRHTPVIAEQIGESAYCDDIAAFLQSFAPANAGRRMTRSPVFETDLPL